MNIIRNRFGLHHHRRLRSFRIIKSFGLIAGTVFFLQLRQRSCVKRPDRARFEELREQVQEPEALQEAQSILVRCGAISYCLHELLTRYEMAKALLAETALPDPTNLEKLLADVVGPLQELIVSLGEELPEALRFDTPIAV